MQSPCTSNHHHHHHRFYTPRELKTKQWRCTTPNANTPVAGGCRIPLIRCPNSGKEVFLESLARVPASRYQPWNLRFITARGFPSFFLSKQKGEGFLTADRGNGNAGPSRWASRCSGSGRRGCLSRCFALLCGISELTTERATGPVAKAIQIRCGNQPPIHWSAPSFNITLALAVICYPKLCQFSLVIPTPHQHPLLTHHASHPSTTPIPTAAPIPTSPALSPHPRNRNPKHDLLPRPPQRHHRPLHHLRPLRPRHRLPRPGPPAEMAAKHRLHRKRHQSAKKAGNRHFVRG